MKLIIYLLEFFFFRDGVGDGQLPVVRDFELPQVQDAVKNFAKKYTNEIPQISVIIVQKRINMKMFIRKQNDLDNPPPGSIMDHTVIKKKLL